MGVPQGSFNFHIGLDGEVQIKQSLRSLKADVSGLTQAWKAQETNLKSAGQSTAAAEAKYKGLTESIKSQKLVVQQLRDDQAKLDTSTEKGTAQFAKQQKAISQAEAKLASLSAQQRRAKESMDYYKSGLAGAQENLKRLTSMSDAYVKRLQAEGKQNQANGERLRGLKEQYSQMGSIYQKQSTELERIATQSGKTSSEYAKQATRVHEMGVKMADARGEMRKLVGESATTNRSIAKMRDVSAKTGDAIKTAFSKAKGAITGIGIAAGTAGAALIAGAKQASTLQKTYTETTNLLVSGGEKQAEVTKNIGKMQSDGATLAMKYGKSQKSIAEAYQDLVKRGYTSSQALGVMKTELQGSVASGDDFSDVVEVASQTIEGFGLRAKTTGEMTKNTKTVVNALAYAADMTASGFSDMGVAMSYVSATAKSLKMNVSETASAVGILSNNGVEADKAGTGLRKVLNSLADPSEKTMKSIGLTANSFKDAHGNLLPLTKSMEILREHTQKLSTGEKATVFKSLFGTTGMQAGQILAEQAAELKKVTGETEKAAQSGTYVQKIADKNNQSAQQSLARFKQSVGNLQIMMSAKLLPVLSKAADAMSKELAKPSTQKTIEAIATGIDHMATNTIDFVKYLADHKGEVKAFAVTVASIWATGKIVGFISKTKEAIGLLKTVGAGKLGQTAGDLLGGYTAGGALGSAKAAGGFKQLTTAGKFTNGLAGAGVAVDAGMSIYKAFTSKDMTEKFSNAGKGIGSALGGGIGLFFGGPLGAALGASVGKVVGGWGGKAAKSFTDGWNKKGRGEKKPTDLLGKLGYDTRSVGDDITKWWNKVNKAEAKAQKEQFTQQQKANADLKKDWDKFWNGVGDGANSFKKDSVKKVSDGITSISKSLDKGKKSVSQWSKDTKENIVDWGDSLKKNVSDKWAKASKSVDEWNRKTYFSSVKWLHSFESDMRKLGLVGAISKQLSKVGSTITKWGKSTLKKWKSDWSKISKATGDSLKSANKTITKWERDTSKWLKAFNKSFSKTWKKQWSDARKSAKTSFNQSKKDFKAWGKDTTKSLANFKKNFSKSWTQHWKSSQKTAKSNLDTTQKNIGSWGTNTSKWLTGFKKSFSKSWDQHWKDAKNNAGSNLDRTRDKLGSWGSSVNKWWSKFSSPFKRGWEIFWGGLGNFVGAVFDGVKKDIKNAMNSIIGTINGAIGGVNFVINKFGGKEETIKPIKKLATGTGAISGQRRAITTPTLAMLNDGPEADNRELVVKNDGRSYMHSGRNVIDMLAPGDEVLNAAETKMLFNGAGITHFATGTGVVGWFKDLLGGATEKLKMITNAVAHPVQAFDDMIGSKMGLNGLTGDVQNALGKGFKDATVDQMKKWWSAMWSLFDGAANGGGEGGPWAHTPGSGWMVTSGFGNRGAVAGGFSAHDGVDFSGARLVHAMHGGTVTRVGGAPAGWGGDSGIGESVVVRGDDGYSVIYQELNGKYNSGAGIRVKAGDTVKTGDALATLGASGTHVHVGVTKHPMFSIGGSSTAGWLDVTKMKGSSTGNKNKPEKGLAALVKSQLGPGVFSWIAKYIAPLLAVDDSASGSGDPAGSGVARWKPDVEKALKKLGLSTSSAMVAKVLRQINTESGGNAKVIGGDDGLADGKAMGLMQVKPGTFNAYKLPGHGNIMNGYDNMLAGLNYAKHRYGSALSFLGNGHGYANGGFASKPSIFGEAGMEAAIPLSQVKASRGYEMLGKTAAAMAARDNLDSSQQSDPDGLLDKIERLTQAVVQMGKTQVGLLKIIADKGLSIDGHELNRATSANQSYIQQRRQAMAGRGLAIDVRQ